MGDPFLLFHSKALDQSQESGPLPPKVVSTRREPARLAVRALGHVGDVFCPSWPRHYGGSIEPEYYLLDALIGVRHPDPIVRRGHAFKLMLDRCAHSCVMPASTCAAKAT